MASCIVRTHPRSQQQRKPGAQFTAFQPSSSPSSSSLSVSFISFIFIAGHLLHQKLPAPNVFPLLHSIVFPLHRKCHPSSLRTPSSNNSKRPRISAVGSYGMHRRHPPKKAPIEVFVQAVPGSAARPRDGEEEASLARQPDLKRAVFLRQACTHVFLNQFYHWPAFFLTPHAVGTRNDRRPFFLPRDRRCLVGTRCRNKVRTAYLPFFLSLFW